MYSCNWLSLLHRQQQRKIGEVSTVHACCAFGVNAHCLFTSLSSVYINSAVIFILCVLYFWRYRCMPDTDKCNPMLQLAPILRKWLNGISFQITAIH